MQADAKENARKARAQEGRERDLEAARCGGRDRKRWCGRGSWVWIVLGVVLIVGLLIAAGAMLGSQHGWRKLRR